jgi:hypothetical protein
MEPPSNWQDECLEEQTSSSSPLAAAVVSSSYSVSKNICIKSNNMDVHGSEDSQPHFSTVSQKYPGFVDFKFDYPSSLAMRRTYRLIEECIAHRVTSMQLRRLARNLMKEELLAVSASSKFISLMKPSALCASEMCTTLNMSAGLTPIADCDLVPEAMKVDHLRMHFACDGDCYFWKLYEVARCGWRLPNQDFKVRRITRNHSPFDSFGSYSQEAFDKQMSLAGAVEEVPFDEEVVINPLLSVIRNSDMWRAQGVGVCVTDEASLREANLRLDAPIKVRVCLDAGASGQNANQPDFPFSYASIQDAVALMTPGCFMAKLDLAHMYLTLGLSLESRQFFGFTNRGRRWRYKRMPFGVKLASCVLTAFMAEVLEIARFEGVMLAIVYVDDWFIVGATYAECLKNMKIIMAILKRHGWSIEETKTTLPCQRTEFIGIELDSISMTVSIAPEKAESVLFKFKRAAQMMNDSTLSSTLVRSLAGNCMWFSSVVNTGKIYTFPLFKLVRLIDDRKAGHARCQVLFQKAFSWWQKTLECWISGAVMRSNVRVICSNLVSSSIVMQQDAGDEGLGYFWVTVKDDFKHLQFAACLLPSSTDTIPSSSTFKELSTLAWALPLHIEWSDRLLIVVFDSSAAAFAINHGASSSDSCMSLIETIYMTCDSFNITLVALWVPREQNTFSDMLTHICVHNRTTHLEGEFDL